MFFLSIGQRDEGTSEKKTVDGSLIFCFFSAVSLFCGAYFTTEGRLSSIRDGIGWGDGQTINYSARVGYSSRRQRGPFLSPKATAMDDGRFWNLNLYRGTMHYLLRHA